jgi:shikimate kinase
MILRLKRTPGIYLVGFMGSGKSTLGKLLAEEIGWTFADSDDLIEQATGLSIPALFESKGEDEFRNLEHQALRKLVDQIERGRPHVVALGGGAFVSARNVQLLQNNGVSIWLDCPVELLERRVARHTHRPLAKDPARFRQLFEERRAAYSRADYRIDIAEIDAQRNLTAILQLPIFD